MSALHTREFLHGVVAGLIAAGIAAAFYNATRRPRAALPAGGLFFTAAGVVALATWRHVPGLLLLGLAGLAAAAALVTRLRLPLWSVGIASLPFAWLIAEHGQLPRVGGLRVAVVVIVCVFGPLVVAGDRAWKSDALGPAFLTVAIAGVFVCTPDTEEVRTLLGVAIVLAALGWPLRWLRLGSAGSVAAIGLLSWASAIDARGRPATMWAAVLCVGALGVVPLVASVGRSPVHAPTMIVVYVAVIAVAVITMRTIVVPRRPHHVHRALHAGTRSHDANEAGILCARARGDEVGAAEEEVALAFLRCTEGKEQDIDGLVGFMADDVTWQINVPSWSPIRGRDAARRELERENGISTGLLAGSKILNIASNDRAVFVERVDVFAMGDKQISLRINGVLEVESGKIVAWREYYDSVDLAKQLGVEPRFVVEA